MSELNWKWTGRMLARSAMVGMIVAGATVPVAAQDKVTLRLGTFVNKIDVRYSGLQYFAEQVSKKTDGRVTIQIFDSGTLHPFDKPIDSILGGVSDISPLAAAGIDKRLPCALQTQFLPIAVDWGRIVDLDNRSIVYVSHSREIVEGSAKIDITSVALTAEEVAAARSR